MFDAVGARKPVQALIIAATFAGIFILLDYTGLYSGWGSYQLAFATQKIGGDFTAIVPREFLPQVNANKDISVLHIQKVGDVALVTAHPKSPIRLWQLHSEWGIHIGYGSVDVHSSGSYTPSMGYVTTGKIHVIASHLPYGYFRKTYGSILFELSPTQTQSSTYPQYTLKLSLAGCTPEHVEILKAIFKDIGIERSVVEMYLGSTD